MKMEHTNTFNNQPAEYLWWIKWGVYKVVKIFPIHSHVFFKIPNKKLKQNYLINIIVDKMTKNLVS
jgi:hypothetical protein